MHVVPLLLFLLITLLLRGGLINLLRTVPHLTRVRIFSAAQQPRVPNIHYMHIVYLHLLLDDPRILIVTAVGSKYIVRWISVIRLQGKWVWRRANLLYHVLLARLASTIAVGVERRSLIALAGMPVPI